MATVTSFTAARMQEIEDNAITAARIEGGQLIFTTHAGEDINVGTVAGVAGPAGTGVVFLDDGESSAGVPNGTKICRRYP